MAKKIKLLSLFLGLSFCIFLFFVGQASADKVVLENGDSLTGTIVKAEGGKLTLKTDYAGLIEIEVAKVKQLFTDSPVEVHLTDGEILKGQIKTVEDGKLAVGKSIEREATVVALQKVASINPTPKVLPKWKGNITGAGTAQSGNTKRDALSISADALRRTENDRFSARYLFNYGRDSGKMNTRNHYFISEYDYFFTKKWFGLATVEFLNDIFQDLNLRTSAAVGGGYQFFEDEIKALAVSAGLAYVNENHDQGQDKSWISARVEGDFRYKIFDFLSFSEQLILYPPLESGNSFLLRNDAALTTPIGKRWALRLENIVQYNSKPASGFKKTDLTTMLGLQYSFY
jgi:putative salt-induced outer membrane protein YdiY